MAAMMTKASQPAHASGRRSPGQMQSRRALRRGGGQRGVDWVPWSQRSHVSWLAHTLVDHRLLTDRGRQDVHLAAVLGDSAASDADTVIEEAIADLGVAEGGASGALVADDLLNYVFDA
jgi:hypothetical protein